MRLNHSSNILPGVLVCVPLQNLCVVLNDGRRVARHDCFPEFGFVPGVEHPHVNLSGVGEGDGSHENQGVDFPVPHGLR